MEFDKVIRERKATRKFSDKKVSQDMIDNILESGRIAPTAKNIQPFKVFAVNSEEGLVKVDKATRCRYNAPLVFIVCGDKGLAYHKDDYSTYEMDSCIVATHMMLEATNIGLDNIWVELFDSNVLRSELNIPDNYIPVCLINVGYKSDDCPVSPFHNTRKEIEELVEYR